MRVFLVLLLVTSCYSFWGGSLFESVLRSQGNTGGGGNCAGCTIAIGLVEQMAEINEVAVDKVLLEVCSFFPKGAIQEGCDYLVNTYGDEIIQFLENHESADTVCHHLGVCTLPTCWLFEPPSKDVISSGAARVRRTTADPGETPWEFLKKLINDIGNLHQPIEDPDQDKFASKEATLRGYNWRGRDCNDFSNKIYPGRQDSSGESVDVDHNCNGISGRDSNGDSYEKLLCDGTDSRGVIVIGDSAGAHFEIPPTYLNASTINASTFKIKPDILYRIENEFDIPYASFGTGYIESTSSVPVHSLYKVMRERNLCNHRDYQNTGVNGARSGAVANGDDALVHDFARSNKTDKPVSIIFELIGNDVCDGHPDYMNHMTTVADFRKNILHALDELDAKLPPKSHVMFVGLADGRVLWDNLYNRTHPINTTYSNVYHFLNCLEISPCYVWMNRNETIRNAGTTRALELNKVYGEIIANHTYKNFDMIYYDFPFNQIAQQWKKDGGEIWQLIEPIDGFHPNQIANALIAEAFVEQLKNDMPSFLGEVNPNNVKIMKLFGDQGGY